MNGLGCYILAEFPPQQMGDLKSAIMQMRFAEGCDPPRDLFRKIPDLKPSSKNFFEPLLRGWAHPGADLVDHYKILNMDHLLALPRWSWYQIYQAPEILEHGVQGAIDHSISTDGDLRTIEPTLVPCIPNTITLQTIDESWS